MNPQPYDAGNITSQDLASWHPSLNSADSAYLPARDLTVARIRDLVRNDGWAASAVTREVDSVVGSQLRLSARPDYRALGLDADWAAEWSAAVEPKWREWANDPLRWCDAERRLTFGRMMALAYRSACVDGECLIILPWLPSRGGRYATTMQLIDTDRLSNRNDGADTHRLKSGVELDRYGAPAAYHVRSAHPHDDIHGVGMMQWTRIRRETEWGRPNAIHYFEPDRPGQTRGISRLTPVVGRVKQLSRYDQVELQAAILNAVLAAFIESPMGTEMLEGALGDGGALEMYQEMRASHHEAAKTHLGGVRIPVLAPGERIGFHTAARPNTAFADFEAAALRNIASAVGIGYEQLSGDYSSTNYSSLRGAMVEVWRGFMSRRASFTSGVCDLIYLAWLEEAIDRGIVKLPAGGPDFYDGYAAYGRARWIGPGRGWVDPVKEAQASKIRIETGMSTLEDEAADQGRDWEEIIDQRKRERGRWEEAGLPDPALAEVMGGQNQPEGSEA